MYANTDPPRTIICAEAGISLHVRFSWEMVIDDVALWLMTRPLVRWMVKRLIRLDF